MHRVSSGQPKQIKGWCNVHMHVGSPDNRSQVDLQMVEGLVAEHLGVQGVTLSSLPGFAGNWNLLIQSEDQRWVLKCCSREELEAERLAIGLAAEHGVPIPEILAMDTHPDPFPLPFILMRFCAGEPVASDAGFRDAGRHVAALHQIEVTKFGHLKGKKYATKKEELDALRESVIEMREARILSRSTTQAVIYEFRRAVSSDTGSPRLLHGDLQVRHILAEGGAVKAFIDWADAAGGDPLLDLARLSLQTKDGRLPEAFTSSYTLVHQLPIDLDTQLASHRIIWSIYALLWEIAAEGDWIAPMIEIIETELTKLGHR